MTLAAVVVLESRRRRRSLTCWPQPPPCEPTDQRTRDGSGNAPCWDRMRSRSCLDQAIRRFQPCYAPKLQSDNMPPPPKNRHTRRHACSILAAAGSMRADGKPCQHAVMSASSPQPAACRTAGRLCWCPGWCPSGSVESWAPRFTGLPVDK